MAKKTDYSSMPFEVSVKAQKFDRRFDSYKELADWARNEHEVWRNALEKIKVPNKSLDEAFNHQVDLWLHLVKHAENESAGQLEAWFENDLERGYPIISTSGKGRILLELLKIDQDAAIWYFIKIWKNYLEDFRTFQSYLEATDNWLETEELNAHTEQDPFYSFLESLGTKIANLESQLDPVETRIEGLKGEVKRKFDDIINTQMDERALSALESNWGKRATSFLIQIVIGGVILAICFIPLFLGWYYSKELWCLITTSDIPFSGLSVTIAAVVLAFYFTLLRLGLRMINQGVLGRVDALERIAMIASYLTFQANGMLDDSANRELILRALFRPSPHMNDDGDTSSTIIEAALNRFTRDQRTG